MKRDKKWLLLIGIILLAFNLRPQITGVGPLVSQIQAEWNLGNSMTGFITTIPLLAFAVVSPFVGRVSSKVGVGKTIVMSLVLITFGILLRSYTNAVGFFLGTAMIGIGIAFGNVLLPSIIKAAFPEKVGPLTGIYTMCLSTGAGLATAVSIPVSNIGDWGWKGSLAVWAVPAAMTLIVWLSLHNFRIANASDVQEKVKTSVMLKSPLTWSVSVYMGLQSLLFYSFVAWLPSVLQSKGITPEVSGYYTTVYQWVGVPASFAISVLAAKYKDQRGLAAFTGVSYMLGILLIWLNSQPLLLLVGIVFCALPSGASLSLAMCFISMRTKTAAQTSALSGISQSFGYAVAAISPTLLGAIYGSTGSWTASLWFLIAISFFLMVSGLHAGQNKTIASEA